MAKLKFYHISGAVSLLIAGVAASFSVYGLSTLFAGAKTAGIVLFSALEIGKILTVSLLYNYAKKLPPFVRKYLPGAVFVLMFLTSLGIFGYLSSAYQQSADVMDATVTEQSYNMEQQNLVGERINNYRQQIVRLNSRVDILNKQRSAQEERLNQAQTALNRRMQTEARADIKRSDDEIAELNKQIDMAYENIAKENDKLNTLKAESFTIRKKDRQTELGPLRYLAKLFSGNMDSVVTILILLLVFVFDPLAIILWLSTNAIAKEEKEKNRREKQINKPTTVEVKKMPETLDEFKSMVKDWYRLFQEDKKKKSKQPNK